MAFANGPRLGGNFQIITCGFACDATSIFTINPTSVTANYNALDVILGLPAPPLGPPPPVSPPPLGSGKKTDPTNEVIVLTNSQKELGVTFGKLDSDEEDEGKRELECR